jgi:hypothetical protein
VECGLVGSMTFCFFSYHMAQRPPEDAYAVHCYWEMEYANLIEESDVQENPDEYASLLKQWRGGPLENPRMLCVAEISPELQLPQRLVGLASTRLAGIEGWVVLDGERSQWYPKSDMPVTFDSVTLKIHVGRYLLGLSENADRKKYIAAQIPPKPPDLIIDAYRKLLSDAQSLNGKARKDALCYFKPLGRHFNTYVDALLRAGRVDEITGTIQALAPEWEFAGGFLLLGAGAFKCGQFDLAEGLLDKSRVGAESWERNEEVGCLAEIWCMKGRQAEAKSLLIEALRRLFEESKTASGSDRQLFEKWFQNQRAALLKLFPQDGEAALTAGGIPSSTLV